MPTVLVTDQINPAAVSILKDVAEVRFEAKLSPEALLEAIRDVDGLMIRSASQVTAEVLAHAPQLKIIGRAGVGTDNIDLKAATQSGCIVVNSPDGNTVAAAEHTLGLLFALARHIPAGDSSLKAGRWDRKQLTGVELRGKTLGLIGLGKIGSRVAKVAVAMGMKVLVSDPYVAPSVPEQLGATWVSFEELLPQADFLTIHVPKTAETTNLLNAERLKQCKRGVRIINCARGGIINEADLAAALKEGQVAGAALDVFSQEPPAEDNPLLGVPEHTVLTPHLGASTEEAQVNVAIDVAQQLRDFFQYGTARSAVNIPLLRAELLEPVKAYMSLAETLGCFARQLLPGAVEQVNITCGGQLHPLNTAPLTLAVLKGLLSVSREGVNYVNAPVLAETLGLQVQERKQSSAGSNFSNRIQVSLQSDTGHSVEVSGSQLADGLNRVVSINHFATLLEPTGTILIAPHHDQPGMVAQVAGLLGQCQLNINAMQVGCSPSDPDHNMMILNLDGPIQAETMAQIAELPGFVNATQIQLS